jgi:hypothetical protein
MLDTVVAWSVIESRLEADKKMAEAAEIVRKSQVGCSLNYYRSLCYSEITDVTDFKFIKDLFLSVN